MTKPGYVERVIAAGADLFMRYGFRRTTMGQIAASAGISRPTLYQHFPGKEDVYEAAVLYLNDIRMAEIAKALAGVTVVSERLYTACDLWLVRVYELQQSIPDARDMDDLSFPVVRKVYRDLEDLIARLIGEGGASRLPASPEELAAVLVFAIRGMGACAATADDLRRMARLQIGLLCKALGLP